MENATDRLVRGIKALRKANKRAVITKQEKTMRHFSIIPMLLIIFSIGCSGKPDPSVINSEFQTIGYFKNDALRGFTYFVTNPNKQDIEAFCQKEKASFPSGRILKIHFFDDRDNTPNVTLQYDFPESSNAYLVADYFFNPFNGKQGLKVHKNIPEQPKKRRQ